METLSVASIDELRELLNGEAERCRAILGIGRSRGEAGRKWLTRLAEFALERPVVVVDESYDERFGEGLVEQGVQDYLDVSCLERDQLLRVVSWSILRQAHRPTIKPIHHTMEPDPRLAMQADRDWNEIYRVYRELPPREREVAELLINGRDPKQIARQLRLRWTTVRNYIAKLKQRFQTESTQQLVILIVRALYEAPPPPPSTGLDKMTIGKDGSAAYS